MSGTRHALVRATSLLVVRSYGRSELDQGIGISKGRRPTNGRSSVGQTRRMASLEFRRPNNGHVRLCLGQENERP